MTVAPQHPHVHGYNPGKDPMEFVDTPSGKMERWRADALLLGKTSATMEVNKQIRNGPASIVTRHDAREAALNARADALNAREFIRRGVIVRTVINGLTFDGATKDPMQQAVRDSLIAFMAATAQAQAEIIKEAQKAGIAHAQAHDDGMKYRGRKPTFSRDQFTLVRELLHQEVAVSAIAKTTGLKRQSIYRIQAEPERQLAALLAWYPSEVPKQSLR